MNFESQTYYDFDDVLIKPKTSIDLNSRSDVQLERTFTFPYSTNKLTCVPIVASNMDTVGTFDMFHALSKFNIPTMMHKFHTLKQWREYVQKEEYSDCIIPSFGIRIEDVNLMENVLNLKKLNVDKRRVVKTVAFDVANGHMQRFVDFIKVARETLGSLYTIIAGNVATAEGTHALITAGADIVKVGIGSGKQCLTRMKTGVGVPQLSAIIECADVAHGLGAHIISDGGIRVSSDISKAYGAGADFVMIGTMFAGFDESGGRSMVKDGQSYKEVYGMSSTHAMNKYYGEQSNYRSSEGEYNLIKCKGPIEPFINDMLGGIRSTMTYIGAKRIKDIPKCTTFIPVNRIRG